MNFLSAIKHAVIGYGIRRKTWEARDVLHLDNNGDLRWVNRHDQVAPLTDVAIGANDIGIADIRAKDWETV